MNRARKQIRCNYSTLPITPLESLHELHALRGEEDARSSGVEIESSQFRCSLLGSVQ